MNHLESALAEWKRSLCQEVEIGSLFARNPIVHKWKAPARSVMLREALGWRTHDLLTQATVLLKSEHVLGCRILIRSAFESIALLAYLNLQMRKVVEGEMTFYDFSDKTTQMMLGSKDKSTPHESVNIITVIAHVEKRFAGIKEMYGALSESAHPNYEGTAHGMVKSTSKNTKPFSGTVGLKDISMAFHLSSKAQLKSSTPNTTMNGFRRSKHLSNGSK
jgi:hypothetical protein